VDTLPRLIAPVQAQQVTPVTDPFQYGGLLSELLDDFDAIHLAGDASGFAFPVHSTSGGFNIYYTPSAPEWDPSSQRSCLDSPHPPPPPSRLQWNETTVTRIPSAGGPGSEHRIRIRSWASFNDVTLAPVIPHGCFTCTVPGLNDNLGIPIESRHPTSYGIALGGMGGNGLGLDTSWDQSQPVTGTVLLLGFRFDGAFIGLAPVDSHGQPITPVFGFVDDRIIMEPLVVHPEPLAINPSTNLPDLSTGVGPINWSDGMVGDVVIYAIQIDLVAFEGASHCNGDIADDFGFTVADGGGPDGVVDFGDFAALLGLIGPCAGGAPGCLGDIADDFGLTANDGGGPDGFVDFGDFAALLGLIGPCP